MKSIKGPIAIFCLAVALGFDCAGKPDSIDGAKGVQLMSGGSAWLAELGKLKSPAGILPTGTNFSSTRVIYKDPATFNEFFVFDDNASLILLSANPLYFMKIDSRDFKFKLSNELAQINAGKAGTGKSHNSITFYKEVGDYSVEIYFTPKELSYTSTGSSNAYRIKDKNDTTYVDLWRLAEAANNVVLYSPQFDEQKIADDFYSHYTAGKRRLILANASNILNPVTYNITTLNLGFSFMSGTGLTITDNLLGPEDINFQDRYALMRDFIAFFSLPMGNSKDTSVDNDFLSKRDGIVVIVRGELSSLRRVLSGYGVNFAETPITPVGTPIFPSNVVINEIASNCGGVAANDYVELYNRSGITIDLTGWRLFRDSGCNLGNGWSNSITLTGTIAPGSYKLVVGSTYAAGGSCPTADIVDTASLTLSASDCLALTTSSTQPTTAAAANVVDFVGYGQTTNTHEGASVAAQMGGGNNQCISRTPNGSDTDDNGIDFYDETILACTPRAANPSITGGTAPSLKSITPINSTTVDLNFDYLMAGASINGFPNRFTFDNSLTSVDSQLLTSNPFSTRRVRITTSTQASDTNYLGTVALTVTEIGGTAMSAAARTANFYGYSATFGIMESGTGGMDSVANWNNLGGGVIGNNAGTVYQGTQSITWTTLTTSCTGGRQARTNNYYPVTPGGAYNARMYMKAGTVTGGGIVSGRFRIYWFKDTAGTPASNPNDLDSGATAMTNGSAWTLQSGSFTAASDAFYAQPSFHACYTAPAVAGDQIYFDQVYFGP